MHIDEFLSHFSQQRRLGPSSQNRRGYAAIDGVAVPYDSSLEFDFLRLIRRDPAVLAVVAQPRRIAWTDSAGRRHRYVPDFAVLIGTADKGIAFLIEVKPSLRVRRADRDTINKWGATADWCRVHGIHFALFTEQALNPLDNRASLWTRPPPQAAYVRQINPYDIFGRKPLISFGRRRCSETHDLDLSARNNCLSRHCAKCEYAFTARERNGGAGPKIDWYDRPIPVTDLLFILKSQTEFVIAR